MKKYLFVFLMLICCGLSVKAQQQNEGGKTRPKVGLVLGGGGARGAAATGILKELEREKIPVDYITGTSTGTIIGGLHVQGYHTDDLEKLFRSQNWLVLLADKDTTLAEKVCKEEDGVIFLFGLSVRKKADTDKNTGFWMLHGDHIYNFLDSLISRSPVQHGTTKQAIPFSCVAFDTRCQQEIVLDTGSLARNVRVGMAIPGTFKPVQIGTLMLVDGGMGNNFPVGVVRKMGAGIVIAVDLQQCKRDDYRSPSGFPKRLEGILGWSAERPDIKKYNINRAKADPYINPDLGSYGVASFNAKVIKAILRIGEDAGILYREQLGTFMREYQR